MDNKFCINKKTIFLIFLLIVLLTGLYFFGRINSVNSILSSVTKAATIKKTTKTGIDDKTCKDKYPLYDKKPRPNYSSASDFCAPGAICDISSGFYADNFTTLCNKVHSCCRAVGDNFQVQKNNFYNISDGYCDKALPNRGAVCVSKTSSCPVSQTDQPNTPCYIKNDVYGLDPGKCCMSKTLIPTKTPTQVPTVTPTLTPTPTPNYLKDEDCGESHMNCLAMFGDGSTAIDNNNYKNTDKYGKTLTSVCAVMENTPSNKAICMISLEKSSDKYNCDGQQFAYPVSYVTPVNNYYCLYTKKETAKPTKGQKFNVCKLYQISVNNAAECRNKLSK